MCNKATTCNGPQCVFQRSSLSKTARQYVVWRHGGNIQILSPDLPPEQESVLTRFLLEFEQPQFRSLWTGSTPIGIMAADGKVFVLLHAMEYRDELFFVYVLPHSDMD